MMIKRRTDALLCVLRALLAVFVLIFTGACCPRQADSGFKTQRTGETTADWPQWRCDAGHGASTPEALPAAMQLQWVRALAPPRPAWPASQPALRFDESYCPVAAGGLLFVPSNVNDRVTAYDLETGAERWRFYADGPVRLAPVANRGRVYFGSDDGYLYCLDAVTGRLRWRVRGGPADRRVLGNGRLISTWPVRGGPVLLDGRIYFTAGIWPFMGIFVHCVDARTGKSVWIASGDSATYLKQPHNSPAFAGFVPRGHLAATPFGLVAPGGRTQPGCYDLRTGRLESFSFGPKSSGTYRVGARGPWFFAGGSLRRIGDGRVVQPTSADVYDERAVYGVAGDALVAESLEGGAQKPSPAGRKKSSGEKPSPPLATLWRAALPEPLGKLFLKAGPRFYFGRPKEVAAVEVRPATNVAYVVWRAAIEGDPWAMLAASGRLTVVTRQGAIYCFGQDGQGTAKRYREPDEKHDASSPDGARWKRAPRSPIAQVLGGLGSAQGYAVVFGAGLSDWIDAIGGCGGVGHVSNVPRHDLSDCIDAIGGCGGLEQIVVDPDPAAIDRLRRQSDRQGLYGTRLSAQVGDVEHFALPPYLASLVVAERVPSGNREGSADWLRRIFKVLRPYGGAACLAMPSDRLEALAGAAKLAGARIKPLDKDHALLIRAGALAGAADWTHQYADPANSVCSADDRVKAPLGLLWFGGPSNDEVLPRHGHGPSPQVAGGRLVIEGPNMLRAVDVYTGRLLWQAELPKLGTFYDVTTHQPGANEIGGNYVTLTDAVYVAWGKKILKLEASSGKRLATFDIPGAHGGPPSDLGYLAAWGDFLAVTSAPLALDVRYGLFTRSGDHREPFAERIKRLLAAGRYGSTSRRLMVLDRHSGKLLWEREARYGFRHNNIALGNGRLFVIDGLTKEQRDALEQQGEHFADYAPRLLALQTATGRELWSTGKNVFGTFLGYSVGRDILLQAESAGRDRAADEVTQGMVAYRGRDGRAVWRNLALRYNGPCILLGDTIQTQRFAYSLLTGAPKTRPHPLTGEPMPWEFTRNYGCATAVGAPHLLMFRSAAAGYCDLSRDGATGNLGGFKAGCTSNLIPADGVLSAPDFTRTCTCPYQNQTSLALVYDPTAEMWTFHAIPWDGKPVRRVGINFGAPGDRMADDGTLWLDWPSVGGPSPDLPVAIEPKQAEVFRHHSSLIRTVPGAGGLAWVAASGLKNVRRVTVTLAKDRQTTARRYTLRLHFAEVEGLRPGQRVFDVRVQGKPALSKLDIVREAGGPMTALVKTIPNVEVTGDLTIELTPCGGPHSPGPLLSGLEVSAEAW